MKVWSRLKILRVQIKHFVESLLKVFRKSCFININKSFYSEFVFKAYETYSQLEKMFS